MFSSAQGRVSCSKRGCWRHAANEDGSDVIRIAWPCTSGSSSLDVPPGRFGFSFPIALLSSRKRHFTSPSRGHSAFSYTQVPGRSEKQCLIKYARIELRHSCVQPSPAATCKMQRRPLKRPRHPSVDEEELDSAPLMSTYPCEDGGIAAIQVTKHIRCRPTGCTLMPGSFKLLHRCIVRVLRAYRQRVLECRDTCFEINHTTRLGNKGREF